MPRNASGTYTLPITPFVASTTIKSADMNSNLSDIATALTQSLATTGVSTMSGPFLAADGTVAAPSVTFGSMVTTGFYKSGANQISWATAGTQGASFNSDQSSTWFGPLMTVNGNLAVGGNLTVTGTGTLGGNPITNFPSGTAATFNQTAAPTGWTKSAVNNDAALRVVNGTVGSGGSNGLAGAFVNVLQTHLPNVNFNVTDPGHTHSFPINHSSQSVAGGGAQTYWNESGSAPTLGTATTGISVNSGGSGSNLNFNLKYVDVIIATKN